MHLLPSATAVVCDHRDQGCPPPTCRAPQGSQLSPSKLPLSAGQVRRAGEDPSQMHSLALKTVNHVENVKSTQIQPKIFSFKMQIISQPFIVLTVTGISRCEEISQNEIPPNFQGKTSNTLPKRALVKYEVRH